MTPVIMKRYQPLQQYWGSVHHTAYYSTLGFLYCQEELNKEKEKEWANYAKSTKFESM